MSHLYHFFTYIILSYFILSYHHNIKPYRFTGRNVKHIVLFCLSITSLIILITMISLSFCLIISLSHRPMISLSHYLIIILQPILLCVFTSWILVYFAMVKGITESPKVGIIYQYYLSYHYLFFELKYSSFYLHYEDKFYS